MRMPTIYKLSVVGAATVLTLALSGCGGDDPETAGASSATTDASPSQSAEATMTDAMFAAMMIPHHQEGVEVTKLGVDKATTPAVKQIAQRSMDSQQSELPELQQVAAGGGMASPKPPEPPLAKFNEQEMAELRRLSGKDFDLKWLDVLSSHHMAAIMMTDVAMSAGGEAKALQQKIRDGQLKDVDEMNTLRDQLRNG